MKVLGITTGICLSAALFAAPAYAVDMTNARVFVSYTGNDGTCSPQPVSAGPNPNLLYPPYTACRTIQHACDIGVGVPMVHIAPVANESIKGDVIYGTYNENVVCHISGTDAAHPVFFHIAEQMTPLGSMHIIGRSGVTAPVVEFTGNFVNAGCAGCHIEGGGGDGIYMHGTAAQHAVNQKTYYGTDVSRNAGVGVHVRWSDGSVVTDDTIANDDVNGILVEDSLTPLVYGNAVYRIGALVGIPSPAQPAIVLTNSPGGTVGDNKALYAVSVGLILTNSPNTTIDSNHVTAAGYPPFSWTITPTSDTSTDTIINEP